MSGKLEKRWCGGDDLDAFRSFFGRHWGEQHILARDLDFARWQMSPARTTMFGDAALAGVGYWRGAELVGFIGAMPMDFNFDGRVLAGLWLCNLLAAPEYRDHGLGLKLMTAVHALPAEVMGAVGINLRVIPMYRALRYLTADRVPRYLRVLDAQAFAALADGNAWRALHESGARCAPPADVVAQAVPRMDAEWDRFWAAYAARGYFGTERDAAFFAWRYVEHPRFAYHLAVARDARGALRGGAAWRLEAVRDGEQRVARLIELLADDEAGARALLLHVEAQARAAGAAMIDHYSTRAPADALRACGWFADSEAAGDVLPCLFQPLLRQNRDMNYALRVMARAGIPPEVAAARLTVVKSDGDQDRPN